MLIRKTAVIFLIFYFSLEVNSLKTNKKSDKTRILSRRRRYVTFPEGSTFSCAACMTVGVIGQPAPETTPGVFTWGMNWGIAYELPNETQTADAVKKLKGVGRPTVMRRHRRELYGKLETVMRAMGYDGRECILKTLCETTQRLMPKGINVVEEIFRTIFTLPKSPVMSTEPPIHAIYDSAHRLGRAMMDCNMIYKRCPLSLVDLLKGFYDAPPNARTALNMMSMYNDLFM